MKLAVIIGTRGRPRQAAAVIEASRMMASGKERVEYIVACDDDDPDDTAGFFRYWPGVTVDCRPRPSGVAQLWNRCIAGSDADAFLSLADDGFIVTPEWDVVIRDVLEGAFPHPVLGLFALTDAANMGQPTIFVATREWVDAAGFMDERFPFWFSDTALAETWAFVAGRHCSICPEILVVSRPGVFNPRLRDMDLWWDFFAATRRERLAKAAEIRAKLQRDIPQVVIDRLVAEYEARDKAGRESAKVIVARLPEREPDRHYLTARAAAVRYLEAA